MEVVSFSLLQASLEPYRVLAEALSVTGATGPTFDLQITPVITPNEPDSLVIEVTRNNAYGLVAIKDGVKIHEGAGQSILLSSATFQSLPTNSVVDQPIEFRISDRVYISYPNNEQLEDTKFDFEYSDNLSLFQRRPSVNPTFGFDSEALRIFGSYLNSAANYVFKKQASEAISCVRVTLNKSGLVEVESTTGMEAFYAKATIQGYQHLIAEDKLSCIVAPAVWKAGLLLGSKTSQQLYVGIDNHSVTFLSGNTVLTHGLMNFADFPDVGSQIQSWVKDNVNYSFKSRINPEAFQSKLRYLESVGLSARAKEPSFIMTEQQGKLFVKLQGFMSSGSSKIVDKAIIDITWLRQNEIRLPARLILMMLETARTHSLYNFFDLDGLPSVFLMNDDQTCYTLMVQEAPEA